MARAGHRRSNGGLGGGTRGWLKKNIKNMVIHMGVNGNEWEIMGLVRINGNSWELMGLMGMNGN
jgi:hypothetical protein